MCPQELSLTNSSERGSSASSYLILTQASKYKLELMDLPSEVLGKIVDNVLPRYKPSDTDQRSTYGRSDIIALAQVNEFFKSEVPATIQRSSA